ncbi:MAG TPA: FAD binding domain-containing protein [Gaiellaceae bacterium]|jgi:CO/xanthine dehydrogenase FAD-binding subunit|nr:FAD binding domain-containing protein [Gaiellaceae bacterium]
MTDQVLLPTSADEAISQYGNGDGVTIVAGGTIVLPEIAAGRLVPTQALMLHRAGLDGVRSDGGRTVIGAMTPVQALTDHAVEILAQTARHIADAEVRRSATVGGNLCAPAAADAQRGDLGAPLIALGARVRSTGAGGERVEPVEDFLAGDRTGRLVLEIELDDVERRTSGDGLRRRHAHSYAIAAVVGAVRSDTGELRLAAAGVAPTAVRLRTVEQTRNAEDVLRDVRPVDDAVASAAYRSAILPKLVREALDRLERT